MFIVVLVANEGAARRSVLISCTTQGQPLHRQHLISQSDLHGDKEAGNRCAVLTSILQTSHSSSAVASSLRACMALLVLFPKICLIIDSLSRFSCSGVAVSPKIWTEREGMSFGQLPAQLTLGAAFATWSGQGIRNRNQAYASRVRMGTEFMSLRLLTMLVLYLIVHTQSVMANMLPHHPKQPITEATALCVEVDCILLLGLLGS
jgi:hypothetical protein